MNDVTLYHKLNDTQEPTQLNQPVELQEPGYKIRSMRTTVQVPNWCLCLFSYASKERFLHFENGWGRVKRRRMFCDTWNYMRFKLHRPQSGHAPFIYICPERLSLLQPMSWAVALETVWPANPKIFHCLALYRNTLPAPAIKGSTVMPPSLSVIHSPREGFLARWFFLLEEGGQQEAPGRELPLQGRAQGTPSPHSNQGPTTQHRR